MQKQVIIEIDASGNCEIEGKDFQGPECAHFIKEIEVALGTKTSQRDKQEYSQRQIIKDRNTQRTGR